MIQFNPSQLEGINANDPNITMLAGPGSGKTRTLVARVNRLIGAGVQASRIVVITFTNAAADEILTRLGRNDLGYCGTLHGFMLRLLQQYGASIGFTGPITVMDEDDTKAFKAQTIARLNYKGSMEGFDRALITPVDPNKVMNTTDIAALSYHRALIKANMVDFDSILVIGYRAIPKTLQHLHLLVDEYQDSGDWDARIYAKLPIPNQFIIGDPDQSIYGFRGGNIAHILQRCKTGKVIFLEQNYRSDSRICQAAQWLIENNTNRADKKTIPVSTNLGVIDYWTALPNAGREVAAIAADIQEHKCQDDCAVLARTNSIVNQIRELLGTFGVTVRLPEMQRQEFPFWKKAKTLVSLLANPENDFLALQWLKILGDTKEANRIALVAQARKVSINTAHLKFPRVGDINRVCAIMSEYIFQPTVTEVDALIKKLPEGAGIPELAVAMLREPVTATSVPQQKTGVVVSTMHGAKGREFGTVYLPAFEQDVIPSKRKSIDVEEERRLAYVAITRAKHRLVISVCKERQTEWQKTPAPATPSQFISEAEIS